MALYIIYICRPKAKVLGLPLSSNLKWNNHVDEIVKKSRKRLYCLSQLKRSGLKPPELIQFYRTCICPITEYACPVFHDCLPVYLSKDIESIQRCTMRISFPSLSYKEALDKAGLSPCPFVVNLCLTNCSPK